jgi:hypothetical protein
MKILSLSGKKQSGKTTIANLISDIILKVNPKAQVHIISWADSLKEEVSKATGYSVAQIEQDKKRFRPLLQWWGTDFRREICGKPDYWICKLLQKLVKLPNDAYVIIPDTRFQNEVEALKQVSAVQWRIERHLTLKDDDKHKSETELDGFVNWDGVIHNNDTIGKLKGDVIVELEKCGFFKA